MTIEPVKLNAKQLHAARREVESLPEQLGPVAMPARGLIVALLGHIAALEAECDRLRAELRWYADVGNYEEGEGPGHWICEEQCDGPCTCNVFETDGGDRARAALAPSKEGGG